MDLHEGHLFGGQREELRLRLIRQRHLLRGAVRKDQVDVTRSRLREELIGWRAPGGAGRKPDFRKIGRCGEAEPQIRSAISGGRGPVRVDVTIHRQSRQVPGEGTGGAGSGRVNRVVVGMNDLAHRRDRRRDPTHDQAVKAGNQEEGKHRNRNDGEEGKPDEAPECTKHVRWTHAMGPPTGLARPDAKKPIEESAVPGKLNGDRLVEGLAAATAEVPRWVISLATLSADQVASLVAGWRLERTGRGAWSRDRWRNRGRPPRDRLFLADGSSHGWRGWRANAGEHRLPGWNRIASHGG